MTLKTCTKCGNELPATEEFFYKHVNYADGLYSWCKSCCSSYRKNRWNRLQNSRQIKAPPSEIKLMTAYQIEQLKEKYPIGKGIELVEDGKKLFGTITGHFKHFMTVKARHYPTSILYANILIGEVKVR